MISHVGPDLSIGCNLVSSPTPVISLPPARLNHVQDLPLEIEDDTRMYPYQRLTIFNYTQHISLCQ